MVIALGRHRNDIPADQFDPLVLIEDAGRDHGLKLANGEAPPRHALGGLCRDVQIFVAQIEKGHAVVLQYKPGRAKRPPHARIAFCTSHKRVATAPRNRRTSCASSKSNLDLRRFAQFQGRLDAAQSHHADAVDHPLRAFARGMLARIAVRRSNRSCRQRGLQCFEVIGRDNGLCAVPAEAGTDTNRGGDGRGVGAS